MPKNKKKWIDKKNAVTFHLVHRSQQDPLVADDSAPQRVLLAATTAQDKPNKRKEEEKKYGIYFDDDYDYLQHLRETGKEVAHWEQAPDQCAKGKGIKLPSSVFASEVEENVGLLNRAAQQSGLRLDLDPDIVAAMDEDFDFEDPDNELEDDFVLKANASDNELELDEEEEGEYEDMIDEDDSSSVRDRSEDELDDSLHSLDLEDTKSRFTEFSMSSSVVPRNDQLTLLDDRFEKMFTEYDENEIGPLDCEEIEGDISQEDMMLRLADEQFNKGSKVPDPEIGCVELSDSESSSSSEEERLVVVEEKDRWDCESILSTYSNIYNHPKLIVEPKVNKIKVSQRTGMPMNEGRLTARNLSMLVGKGSETRGPASVVSALSTLSLRDKAETPEQKRHRKAALRLYRRERREERKLNTKAFKEEKKLQEKNLLNKQVNNVAVHNL